MTVAVAVALEVAVTLVIAVAVAVTGAELSTKEFQLVFFCVVTLKQCRL